MLQRYLTTSDHLWYQYYHPPNVLYWLEIWCLCTPHGTMDVLQCSRNQLCDVAHLPYGSRHQKSVYWSTRMHNCLPVRQQQWNDPQLAVRVPKEVRKKSLTHVLEKKSVHCLFLVTKFSKQYNEYWKRSPRSVFFSWPVLFIFIDLIAPSLLRIYSAAHGYENFFIYTWG